MNKNIELHFTVNSWEKYNGRSDIKKPNWFRVENTLMQDSKIQTLKHVEFRLFMFILCTCSTKNSSSISTSLSNVCYFCSCRADVVQRSANRLEELQLVSMSPRTPSVQIRALHYTTDTTLHNTTLHNTTDFPDSVKKVIHKNKFDFDKIYNLYPRKEGKKKGLTICNKIIDTSEKYTDLLKAVENYVKHCKSFKTEIRYIKQFSTFMNCFEDWISPDKSLLEEKREGLVGYYQKMAKEMFPNEPNTIDVN